SEPSDHGPVPRGPRNATSRPGGGACSRRFPVERLRGERGHGKTRAHCRPPPRHACSRRWEGEGPAEPWTTAPPVRREPRPPKNRPSETDLHHPPWLQVVVHFVFVLVVFVLVEVFILEVFFEVLVVVEIVVVEVLVVVEIVVEVLIEFVVEVLVVE